MNDETSLSAIERPIQNFGKTSISGKLYFGSDKQALKVIFDTGSTSTWVNSRFVYAGTSKFDERSSESYRFYPAMWDQHYGKGDIYGYWSIDQVCIDLNHCDKNFTFINVLATANVNMAVSGIVGLGAKNYAKYDMFVDKMHKDGVMKKAIFALYINLKGGSSI